MFERTGLPAALAALILAAASAAHADPELAVAPAVSAPMAASQPSEERASPVTGAGQGPEHTVDKADASEPDDEDSQADIDKSAAELEEVRKAEEKAGLLPQAPGTGPRDGLAVGLDGWDPVARDLLLSQGISLDGAPLADPAPAGGAQARLPELAGITEEELRAKYDIPVELNDAVVAYIRFFQTDAREHFSRWLARSTKWLPSMHAILEREGVPDDLVYLSMIESGFNAYAYSPAKAAGLWQFMVGTSRRYGIKTDFWVDERRDPIKATEAASKYLRDLRERYHGDWYLAWAGYNAGEGKVDKAIRRDSTRDFWRLMSKGRVLRAETKHYVPKLIAAALISKHPERFGFRVEYEQPFDSDEVVIQDATDLKVIADSAGTTVEKIRELNPELRRFCTPPGEFTMRLPKGSKDQFTANFEKVGPEERLRFTQHKVEKGEPLAKIARAYGVSESAILRTNGLKSHRQVKVGKVIVIPVGKASRGLLAGSQLEDRRGRAQARTPVQKSVAAATAAAVRAKDDERAHVKHAVYVVKRGDTLWSIAAKFSTTVDRIKRLNGMAGRGGRGLQAGQRLSVPEQS
ncbi:MAG: LysM peptidoglycan-binding domain-containing protein [Myxococcales bacterium]